MKLKKRSHKLLPIVVMAWLIQLFPVVSIAQEYDSNALPREQRMQWWEEARFGMFIHWGLYSIPGGIWNGKEIEELGEWIMAYADIPVNEYEKLAGQLNPEKFDATEWVEMAEDAGMRYLIITTRHHDGFCLFDTKYTDWNVVDATPFKRDIVKELSDACKEAGITFCAYYSILEWHHPAMELNTDFSDLEPFSDQAHDGGPFTNIDSTWRKYGNVRVAEGRKEEFIEYMKAQLKEIVDHYDPGIIWFDGGWVDWWTPEDGKALLDYLWGLDPELIVNNRAAEDFDLDVWYGDYGTPEQTIPLEGLNYKWESCMTMNSTWGYKSHDHNWKSPQLLITQLVDIISKGGNFLLNVGPTAEGTFPPESVERLKEVSDWMKVNGESVYGTNNWKVYKEGRHDLEAELYDIPDVVSVQMPFTARDIKFAGKGNTLYATCLDWPGEELTIRSLGKAKSPEIRIIGVSMLGSAEQIIWEQTRRGLRVSVPVKKPCNYAFVYKILTANK
jgi:alpha-L-fucosidase